MGCSLSRPGRGWPEGPSEGRPRIEELILGLTLTLPTLRAGPFPLPGRERAERTGDNRRVPCNVA
ncbi:hypothetical protein D3869_09325 [Azospirillum brasilense]|uniref:Uncharacterized protein n=1 Tax=Azospirillum brasilense TaxID=192 RepID=A0A4D8QYK6_AZOBR|nr:hypothetical protein D3869_09325 [Azospirillum brasilense]